MTLISILSVPGSNWKEKYVRSEMFGVFHEHLE